MDFYLELHDFFLPPGSFNKPTVNVLTAAPFVSSASKKVGEPLIISDIKKGSVAHRSEPFLLIPVTNYQLSLLLLQPELDVNVTRTQHNI